MLVERHGKTNGGNTWEEVFAPIDCNYYSISSPTPQTFWKCSDKNDADTCKKFDPPGWISITAPFQHPSRDVRWNAGDLITYVKSADPLDLYFLR